MGWNPVATVTINGNDFTADTLYNVNITFGRDNIWSQARPGYATIDILNETNTDYGFNVREDVVIKIEDSSNADVFLFTGKITSITNKVVRSGSEATVAVQTITAVSPLAEMSRTIVGETSYPKEMDDDRIDRILTEAGVSIDVVDTPGVYEFTSRSADPRDAYSLAGYYAKMAFGYVYDTGLGTIGYANESRRFVDARDNGYFTIPTNYILWQGTQSEKTLADITNSVILSYKANATVTSEDLTSQATYGIVSATIQTEIETNTDAQVLADRWITLRATPRTSLSSFTVPIDSDSVTSVNRDKFLNLTVGEPIRIQDLPIAIKNVTYSGFIEGFTISFNRTQYQVNIKSSDYSYSVTPTRWQDVPPAITWNAVDPAVQWFSYDD
jgi:hypothetical protein